jgi:DUF971 family protein
VRNHREDRWLEVSWSDGVTAVLPHRLLREACRCAHCLASARSGEGIRAASGIRLDAVDPYGTNTLRLSFDDGHARGLYPFEYLRELAVSSRPVGVVQQENELANPSSSSGLR